ncbi:proline racemase [Arboricoccus pini]|uniref:Proline racemase n=1 Tax=Arboricoccus pini TaxID=1963835 RepID=A0A212RRQ7_9PROT|nr:proline racemase family protein [Arboricoccus pini]SNB75308.1 proline racemase [Arboricoccus pini]
MQWERTLDLLLVHCEGEIGKVIVGGAPDIPGTTLLDKMNHINQVDDSLRRIVTREPRGFAQMSVNLLTPPASADTHAGFIVLQADRAHPMSGSNCICVVTALIESGRVEATGEKTVVRLDTPAGRIEAIAHVEGGSCRSVSLDNVPAFAESLDLPVETPEWGRIKADIAFGGVYYAIVDVEQIGLAIDAGNSRALAEIGMRLHALISQQVKVQHPLRPGIDKIAYVMFRSTQPDGVISTCTTLASRVDRSPCGTGSSANLATLFARGLVGIGDTRWSRSVTGGMFKVEAIGQTTVAGRPAVIPRITGRGWVYGKETLRMDASDPFQTGFTLSDAWGLQADEA